MTSKIDRYMNEIVDYGGIPTPRHKMIKDLEEKSRGNKQAINMYLLTKNRR